MIAKKDKRPQEITIFIFLNKRIKIVPKYSGTVDITKSSGFLIGGNLYGHESNKLAF